SFERSQVGRAQPQRYLKRIRYGNTEPFEVDESESRRNAWSFELVLDYGDHDPEAPGVGPDRAWTARADSYSSCRPGFELRTWRLCRRFFMFHRFAELGSDPLLLRSPTLRHDEDPTGAMLAGIVETGFRADGVGSGSRALPELRFTYARAAVAGALQSVDPSATEDAPARPAATPDGWYYKPKEGVSRFGALELLEEKPSQAIAALALGDFDRDGNTDLM